jgi:DNA-binding MarR family transcriptional regulator/GNAT superfamily N-acetyltransferase
MSVDPGRIDAVRQFNRFYTRQIGLLHEGLLNSSFSLTESRVLYELAHRESPTASELGKDLGIDAGYLSRILQRFKKQELAASKPAPSDARQSLLSLTKRGLTEAATLNDRSQEEVAAILDGLPGGDQARLVEAMRTIEAVLGGAPRERKYVLRDRQPGDMGWIVHLHGALYAREYGWSEEFEAFVAGIAAEFINNYDPDWERCWIAELDGRAVGSVVVVKESKKVAKLRLLIVDPEARGLGIGTRLVDECVKFARMTGYRRMTLWTNSILHAARGIYEKAGFERSGREKRHSLGQDLTFETWTLNL